GSQVALGLHATALTGLAAAVAGTRSGRARPANAAAARMTHTVVTAPRGRTVPAPATPTRGAEMPPKPKRTMPSTDEAVPAICGQSASASVVAGGELIATPLASANRETITTGSGAPVSPVINKPSAPAPVTAIPTARVPGTLHRSAARPARKPAIMNPAELSPNAADRKS